MIFARGLIIKELLAAVPQPEQNIKTNESVEQIVADTHAAVEAAKNVQELTPEYASAQVEKVDQNLNLGMTAEAFRRKLNKDLKTDEDTGLKPISALVYKEAHTLKSFQAVMADGVIVLGTVDKSGQLLSITFMMTNPKNRQEAFLQMALLATFTMQILDPETRDGTAAQEIFELAKRALMTKDDADGTQEKYYGHHKYFALAGDDLGLWIGVEVE